MLERSLDYFIKAFAVTLFGALHYHKVKEVVKDYLTSLNIAWPGDEHRAFLSFRMAISAVPKVILGLEFF
jgi:hypothetical protein